MSIPLRIRLICWISALLLALAFTTGAVAAHGNVAPPAIKPHTMQSQSSCQTIRWRQGSTISQQASNQDTVTATLLVGVDATTNEFCGLFQSSSSVSHGNGTGGSFVSTLIYFPNGVQTTASSGLIAAYGSFTGNLNSAGCAQAQTTYFPNGASSITVTTSKICPQNV